jgi:hypothetical protein
MAIFILVSCDDLGQLQILLSQNILCLNQMNLYLKPLRFLPLLIRQPGLCTQAFQLGIFNNFCEYILF